jgi:hypothetical protein
LQLDKSAEKDWVDGENLNPVTFDKTEPTATPLAQFQKRSNKYHDPFLDYAEAFDAIQK